MTQILSWRPTASTVLFNALRPLKFHHSARDSAPSMQMAEGINHLSKIALLLEQRALLQRLTDNLLECPDLGFGIGCRLGATSVWTYGGGHTYRRRNMRRKLAVPRDDKL